MRLSRVALVVAVLAAVLAISGCDWFFPPRKVALVPTAPPAATAVAPAPRDPAAVAMDERIALFDALVAEATAVHRFSPNTWENLAPLTFQSATSGLHDTFATATSDAELRAVLTRFGDSLHDAHSGFQPSPPYKAHLMLPLVLLPEWDGAEVTMVAAESRVPGVEPGDVVTSYAGTPAAAILRTYADRSSANQWRGVALDIAAWMTERPVDGGDGTDGATVTIGFHKKGGSDSFANVTWVRGGWHGDNAADLDAPQYDHLRCAPRLAARKYPTYQLTSHSTTYCLYVSKNAKYAAYPVLRFFSFDFGRAFDAEAEYDHLVRAVRGVPGVRGLVLDLRDNSGGNDPNWVLDWFAPKAYLDLRVEVKKTPRLDRVVLEDVANLDNGWIQALAAAGDGKVVSRFLGCKNADCTDTRRLPLHRIAPVPVALLVGPRCNSACDHFARVWEENGLGTIIGEPSGGALTVLHLDYPVVVGGGKLGAMRFAISMDFSPFTGLPVEGLPLHVDVPVDWSWDKRDLYDTVIVDAAIASFTR